MTAKSTRGPSGLILGRKGFAQISKVECIALSKQAKAVFRSNDASSMGASIGLDRPSFRQSAARGLGIRLGSDQSRRRHWLTKTGKEVAGDELAESAAYVLSAGADSGKRNIIWIEMAGKMVGIFLKPKK